LLVAGHISTDESHELASSCPEQVAEKAGDASRGTSQRNGTRCLFSLEFRVPERDENLTEGQ